MDKGTVIRTVTLILALINQFFVTIGKSPLPIDSELVEQLTAMFFTATTSITAWYKNNYVTKTGLKQQKVLCENGLTKGKEKKKRSSNLNE
ncbi:phage holin [Virgibacillus sp. W0181]|uniref:phage holin n=1 Tax=Virgibacillus sp. W0181 TaxID=3391581 RepID=UPI003F47D1DA